MDKNKRFGEGMFPTWYEKKFLTVGAGGKWKGLPCESVTSGFQGPRTEADSHLLEGGGKSHWAGKGLCDHQRIFRD